MKYNFSFLLVLLAGFSVLALDHSKCVHGQINYSVRVLLDEIGSGNSDNNWEMRSVNGFLISDITKDSKVFLCKSGLITINLKDNFIFINNKKYIRTQVKISPKSGDLYFNGNYYQGDFIIYKKNSKLLLVNKLNLEDYVYAVLRSESWPGWPLEVNKVFAIAIRTYVAKRVKDSKKSKRLYHIKNNNSHQTYRGYKYMERNDALLRNAVTKTSGVILTYNNDIIDPLYDSCCGSVVPEFIEDKIDFQKAPYLARKYPCTYCQKCSLYNWEVQYNLCDLEKLLCGACPHIKNIRSIKISKKDKAGLVKEITIRCARRTFKITGSKLYSLLKDVKSFYFSLKKRANNIIITGKGYGHHIGLCQWGARQMVRELFDYKQILNFYYPGTSIVRLS